MVLGVGKAINLCIESGGIYILLSTKSTQKEKVFNNISKLRDHMHENQNQHHFSLLLVITISYRMPFFLYVGS